MARSVDKTDSYISMVLDLNGRVRPADLQSIPQESRAQALAVFAESHGAQRELHLAGDELVAGPRPDPTDASARRPEAPASAPIAPVAPAEPADLTSDGQSAIDLLLGDYDGVPPAIETPPTIVPYAAALAAPSPMPGTSPAPGTGGADAASPEPEAPRDTARAWMLWWVPTLLLPLLGGATAWFFLRNKRQLAARAMLTVGIVLGLLLSVAWLRYAEQIGAVVEQRGADTVIVLPSK